jgi:hypothetical protein
MTDSEEESEENEPELEELDPVAILEGLKKKSSVDENVTDTVEEVDSIHSASPVADKIGINRAVAHTPSPVKTGTDCAYVPMETSGGKHDTNLKEDSLGPSNILKQIQLDIARKYEEDQLAKASKKGFVSQLPQTKIDGKHRPT